MGELLNCCENWSYILPSLTFGAPLSIPSTLRRPFRVALPVRKAVDGCLTAPEPVPIIQFIPGRDYQVSIAWPSRGGSLIKADLAKAVYETHGGISQKEAREIVDLIIDQLKAALVGG